MPSSVGETNTLTPAWDEEEITGENVDEHIDLTIEALHEHVIEHVITKLVQQDLCNFSQASKPIKAKTDRPKFWQLINVSKTKIQQEGLLKLFLIDKFKQVRRIDLSCMNFTHKELLDNLRAVANSSVVELDLADVRVDKVPKEWLAKIARQLTKINLSRTDPTTDQCVAVLQACETSAKMTQVNLEGCHNLREAPVGLLVKALGHLAQIDLNATGLTRQQYQAIFERFASSRSLVDLTLRLADLTDVPPQSLGQLARCLSQIDLSLCDLTRDQCGEVLNACASSRSLVDLTLRGANLTDVPSQTLGQAVRRLTKLNLKWCRLTSLQCSEGLNACASSRSLVDLTLRGNNLTDVPPQTLGQAVRRLTKIDLSSCDLTSDQWSEVLEACVASSTLNQVNISGNDFQEVPAEQLAKAVGNLETVVLRSAELTTEQYNAVLEKCRSSSSKLTDVDLMGADLRQVPSQLLEEAIPNVQRMRLMFAHVTAEQRIGILNAILTSSATVHVDFRYFEKATDGLFMQAKGTGRLFEYGLDFCD